MLVLIRILLFVNSRDQFKFVRQNRKREKRMKNRREKFITRKFRNVSESNGRYIAKLPERIKMETGSQRSVLFPPLLTAFLTKSTSCFEAI